MLEKKQKVTSRLGELQRIQFIQPTALELHAKRPLLHRVQRQEQRLYMQKVEKQKRDFQLKKSKIEKYYVDLQVEEKRRLDLLKKFEEKKDKKEKDLLIPAPVFQPIDVVVPKPVISIQKMPIQVRTRLYSRARAKGLKRLR